MYKSFVITPQIRQWRRKCTLFLLLGMLFSFANLHARENKKVLVAYFSLRGGITKQVAEEIHRKVGGDLFRIEPEVPYPSEYNDVVARAKEERNNNVYPKIKRKLPRFAVYDTIYLGIPVWFGQLPGVVKTFIAQHDFSRKSGCALCNEWKEQYHQDNASLDADAPRVQIDGRAFDTQRRG